MLSASNTCVSGNTYRGFGRDHWPGYVLVPPAPGILESILPRDGSPNRPSPHKPHLDISGPTKACTLLGLATATVVIKVDGLTIVTDPVFSDRVGSVWPPRSASNDSSLLPRGGSALPVIDLILLRTRTWITSIVRVSERSKIKGTTVITASQNGGSAARHKYRKVHELGWGEQARVGSATVRAFEVNHWGARVRTDTYRGFNGYLIETDRHRIVFGGDTAFTTNFRQVRGSRPADLAIMPIGAYNPWIRYHCNPEQAWSMAEQANVEFVLPSSPPDLPVEPRAVS